jgi:hypothetical protein
MSSTRFRFPVLIALLLIGGWPAAPRPALAPVCSGDFAVDSVQPVRFTNTSAVQVVILISGPALPAPVPADSAVVVLGALGALSSRNTDTLVTAGVPAGAPPGVYNLSVIIPGAGRADCAGAITIDAPTATPAPSSTPAASSTPAPTGTPAPTNFQRPVIAVDSYGASASVIQPGEDLDFDLTLVNWGQIGATNIILNFSAGDFAPRVTGGQRVVGALDANQKVKVYQPLTASKGLAGKSVATLEVKAEYTDPAGKAYSESFTLTFPVAEQGVSATRTPTPTATLSPRPQLLVKTYTTDPAVLKPGQKFSLSMNLVNTGAADAQRITLILGGGAVGGGSGPGGTPGGPGGGVSGSGGDLSNFAPLGSSNVQFIGDINTGAAVTRQQDFIVNAGAKAGAYPLKVSLSYTDPGGASYTDDQSITLLVQSPPLVEIDFYKPVDPLMAGKSGLLPIQIVNQGRSSVLLGNITVTAANAVLSNNRILVGNLDAGGSFPLDAVAVPSQAGRLELTVTVDYVDDFNQSQTIVRKLTVDVADVPTPEPGLGPGGGPAAAPEPETPAQMILRFIAGFLGFDSAPPAPPAGVSLPAPGETTVKSPPAP